MKRVMIWGGAILALLVLVFAGLLVVLPLILDPNDYKEKIEHLVYEKSGYQLQIPGDINLQVTPGLDVLFSMGQIQVQSGAAFADTTLLSSEEARVELSLMPLLREKRLAVKGIKLHGVYCNLIRDTKGRGNWEVSSPAATAETTDKQSPQKQAPQQSVQKTEADGVASTFDLGALDLSEISVRYEDQQSKKRFELKKFSVHTDRVQDGHPFHLQSAFTLISSGDSNAALSVYNELESDVTVTLANKTLGLNGFSLHSTINGFGLQETEVHLVLDSLLDLVKKDISLKNTMLSSGLLNVQLQAAISNFSDPDFHGTLSIPEFSLRQFLSDNKLSQPLWKDASALTTVGFSCTFAGDTKEISVSDLQLALDGAQAEGSFVFRDPAHPSYGVTMHLDQLDLDRYAITPPPVSAGGGETTVPGKQSGGSKGAVQGKEIHVESVSVQPLFPVETLRKLNFTLDLGADSMKMKGIRMQEVALKAEGEDGLLQLDSLRAQLYDGSIAAQSTLDVRGKVPQLKFEKNLDHVQLGPLLQDMTGKENVTGTADLALQVESRGNMKKQFMRNINGRMNLSFADGVIRKLHILQVIRQAKAFTEGNAAAAAVAEDEPTGFTRISASGVITDGVLVNKDLQATSDLMKVTGSGKVDLAEEYVDYLLQVSLAKGLDRDEQSGTTDFSKYVIPYHIQGKFSEIQEEADLAGLLKSQAKNILMNELQKQLNKKDDSGKEPTQESGATKLLEQGLKSLFGN